MTSRRPLNESASATADASGRAVVRLGPHRAFEVWDITQTSVQTTSTTNVPEVRLYEGHESPSALIDGSYDGNLNHTNAHIRLQSGVELVAVWSGADVGAVCTLAVMGESRR